MFKCLKSKDRGPSSKPVEPKNPDLAEYVGKVLDSDEEEAMREVVGEVSFEEELKEDLGGDEIMGDLELSAEEQEIVERAGMWTKDKCVEWAVEFMGALGEDWVEQNILFESDGLVITSHFELQKVGLREIPRGRGRAARAHLLRTR